MTPLIGAWKGTLLGIANVFVIACGLAAREGDPEVMPLVLIFGSVPGIALGFLLGLVAGNFAKQHVVVRLAILILPSLGLVYALAGEFGMSDYVVVSMIPTVVAVSMLERWTRWRETPPLPVAHVT